MDNFLKIMKKIKDLPLLTKGALELITLMKSDNYSIADLQRIVKDDPILVTKFLNFVNSSALAKGKQIESVHLALSYLGRENIMRIAINSYSDKIFNKDLDGYACKKGTFKEHIKIVAIASKLIAEYTHNENLKEQAYIAGILHDIGKMVISDLLKGKRKDFIESIEKEQKNGREIEKQLFGADHTDVGFMIANQWKLPKIYQMVIRYHHNPFDAPDEYKKICYIVHLANIISMLYGTGTPIDSLSTHLDDRYEKFLDFKQQDLELIILELNEEYQKLQKMQ